MESDRLGLMKARKYIIFECVGEPAKDIMGTAVAASLKLAHPERDIVVVSAHPDIWLHNPSIYRVYRLGAMAYFYDDFVKNQDTIIFRHDPYATTDFAYGRKHIIDIWCDLCKVPRAGTMPSLHFTWREKEAVGKLSNSLIWPLMHIQASGSTDPKLPYMWQKDIPAPTVERIAAEAEKKGYVISGIRAPHHSDTPHNTMPGGYPLTYRQTLCALMYSKKRLLIDADMIQAATALNLPSVVLYITGSSQVTGYEMHRNIRALEHLSKEERKKRAPLLDFISSYKEGYDIGGTFRTCPFPLDNLFSADEILTSLDL